ncbi:glycosyl hydrolases family 31 domain-containing protein [Hirsutella rhossiliensis]|uniref:alpha-glucosidase n=1 Tax=Hirsutella rhossiliensis TaxID=111463 RepID=A0A9P8SL76_9HYPO|nr:glycosyl hydrolases family 31 domain-containing protein [Hirsutella rhossiliensis]KAH0965974.1 glycosyl hydrolases family 31 domain-containing protein [Hirsutella rhossiliensis]
MTLQHLEPDSPSSPFVKGEKYRFTVLTDGLLRYEWAEDGQFEDRPSSLAATRADLLKSVPKFEVRETSDSLAIITRRFRMTYDKREFTPYGLFVVVTGHTGTTWRYGENNETLGGTRRTLDGVDGRASLEKSVTSRKGFASLDDSASFLFTDDGFVAPRRPGPGRVDGYLFCYGHEYREAVRAFLKLSGPQPLLPRWALGSWWSRYHEYTADSYLELMDAFAHYKVPLSVACVDMDWHLVNEPVVRRYKASGWTGYTWNRNLFPDPPAFLDQLHRRNLKVTLNDHPADGIAPYEDLYRDMARVLHFDTSRDETIPFDISNRAFLNAYHDPLLKSLEDMGVDFWWVDWQQGTESRMPGVDPLWLLNHFHFAKWQKPGRPIVLSRYAGPGSQRYPVGFSGDTVISWNSLNFQPEFTASASDIGFFQWSHDIGGHMFGARDDHLTTRWVQLGVLSPIMRLHSSNSKFNGKEPWHLPAGSGQGPREVVIQFMRLRHRLIPYLHTMNARAAAKDAPSPLVEPMYWSYPEREEAYNVPNQYKFGPEMFVCPITSPTNRATHTAKVRGWLPPGIFVDFFSGVVYDGNRTLWLNRTLDKVPVLLGQGAIVPLDGNLMPPNGSQNPDSFEVVVVVGANGSFEILEEFGDEKRDPDWVKTLISLDQTKGSISIGFKSTKGVRAVVGDKPLDPDVKVAANGLVVALGDVPAGAGATVYLGANPQLAINDPQALIYPILFDAEIEYRLKENIDAIMSAPSVTTAVRASQLEALDMDPDLRSVLTELLLADSRVV